MTDPSDATDTGRTKVKTYPDDTLAVFVDGSVFYAGDRETATLLARAILDEVGADE